MSRTSSYAIVLAVCVGTTFILTPLVRMLGLRLGAVQAPDEGRVHLKTTAVIGGIAMFGGFVAGMLTASRMDAFADLFETSEWKGVLIATTIIVVIGHIDDLKDVSAPAKMAGTVLTASVLVMFGVSLIVLVIPFRDGIVVLSQDLAFPLSVLWVVAMAHAINLIDGLDGLAAGIVGIAATVFFLYTMKLSDQGFLGTDNLGPLIALLVAGMCTGFLPWNVHPAKIFMGDGGALMLGVLMASSTMMVGGRIDQQWTGTVYFFYAPLVIPILVLGVPILDTAFAIVRRAVQRTGVATRDTKHLHNRLMNLGHGHRRTVFILWTWTALLSGVVLYPTYTGNGAAIAPIALAGLLLLLYTVLHPRLRSQRVEEPEVVVAAASVPSTSVRTPVERDELLADLRGPAIADGREIRRKASTERARRRATGGAPGTDPGGTAIRPRPPRRRR